MKYVINRENYKKFPLFEVNKCEGRAYFIPYSNRETLAATSCLEERYKSDLVTVLSGEWDFTITTRYRNCHSRSTPT